MNSNERGLVAKLESHLASLKKTGLHSKNFTWKKALGFNALAFSTLFLSMTFFPSAWSLLVSLSLLGASIFYFVFFLAEGHGARASEDDFFNFTKELHELLTKNPHLAGHFDELLRYVSEKRVKKFYMRLLEIYMNGLKRADRVVFAGLGVFEKEQKKQKQNEHDERMKELRRLVQNEHSERGLVSLHQDFEIVDSERPHTGIFT